jgi:3-oxoadipate enol-lactonase
VMREYIGISPLAYLGTWWKARHHQPLARAAGVGCPALVVVGSEDPVVPDRFLAALVAALPRGHAAIVEDAAHGAVYDRPDRLNRAVIEFLDGVRAEGW